MHTQGGVSLTSMAERTLGKPGARFAGATYLFLHYALLVACAPCRVHPTLLCDSCLPSTCGRLQLLPGFVPSTVYHAKKLTSVKFPPYYWAGSASQIQ